MGQSQSVTEYINVRKENDCLVIIKERNKKITKILYKKPRDNGKFYLIHDNGGRPFLVVVVPNNIKIYKCDNDDIIDPYNELVVTIPLYHKIYIGRDKECDDECGTFFSDGNSILVHVNDNKYIYIGSIIIEFEIDDDIIISYFSPIGNNDVPYPYARGIHNTYLMLDEIIIPNDDIIMDDPYHQYYWHTPSREKYIRFKNIKNIHERN